MTEHAHATSCREHDTTGDPCPTALLATAVRAARAAGSHALAASSRRDEAIQRFRHDVKLALDVECQHIAEQTILDEFPAHRILGEEDPENKQDSADTAAIQWVIDPIDGTVNFSHGLPFWCCSIAARKADQTLAGAVYAPEIDLLFTATVDGPAERNGRPIRVSNTAELATAIVMTGLDKNVRPDVPPLHIFETISANVQKARILGSAALDLCLVAAGAADAYFEAGIYIWDVAAAGLIVSRAGGCAELLKNMPDKRLCFMASNGRIHAPLRALLMTRI